jgi:AraC-like DNA-binding protein
MLDYREQLPPSRLAQAVECFWSITHQSGSSVTHRVLPDGCADILFVRSPAKTMLLVVGAMTGFEDFDVHPGDVLVGVRFRPGMCRAHFGFPATEITDRRPALEDFWGARARSLHARLGETQSTDACLSILAGSIQNVAPRTPAERAFAWMESEHGCISVDDIARQAGLSTRQFRRVCLESTGLSPKLLAQVLRFRHALSHAHRHAGDYAGLSIDCGYFDQSHFIAEFQRFSGRTPAHLQESSR